MWKLLILVAILSTCLAAPKLRSAKAHVKTPSERIVGGEEVEANSIPYQVAVLVDYYVFCGGALLSTDYVLTAAHCLIGSAIVEVVLGGHDRSLESEPGLQFISGSQIIWHEGFDYYNGDNDVGLVKLVVSVAFDQYIQPIALPSLEDAGRLFDGEVAVASGWGQFADGVGTAVRLRAVELKLVSWTECADFYNPGGGLQATDANVCSSGYKARATCGGDSGGPLVLDGVVIGLTSWGSSLCESCRRSVFTRVGAHLDWIYANADLLPTAPTTEI